MRPSEANGFVPEGQADNKRLWVHLKIFLLKRPQAEVGRK
jgi:hypothetical protein